MSVSETHVAKLASLFAVELEQVQVTPHVLDDGLSLVRIRFLRGRRVAAAISSFLNHEFYHPPMGSDLDDLHYSPNTYSFLDETSGFAELCLTIDEQPDIFIDKLREKTADIRYVALHPQILVAMRSRGSYRNAKQSVEKDYALDT
jgi:hypothetical protein